MKLKIDNSNTNTFIKNYHICPLKRVYFQTSHVVCRCSNIPSSFVDFRNQNGYSINNFGHECFEIPTTTPLIHISNCSAVCLQLWLCWERRKFWEVFDFTHFIWVALKFFSKNAVDGLSRKKTLLKRVYQIKCWSWIFKDNFHKATLYIYTNHDTLGLYNYGKNQKRNK